MNESEEVPLLVLDTSEALAKSLRFYSRWPSRSPGADPPSVLLVDADDSPEPRLDQPLADLGFRVFRTSNGQAALNLLGDHPSLLLAVVRMDIPHLDPSSLVRKLCQARPGLWVGMLADDFSRATAAEGYQAGAVDLLPLSVGPWETALRLARCIPWAARMRDRAQRHEERLRRNEARPLPRRLFERWSKKLGPVLPVVLGAGVGALFAGLLTLWQDFQDGYEARFERLVRAIESAAPGASLQTREFDRWSRIQELNRDREYRRASLLLERDRLEEERLKDILGTPRTPALEEKVK
jgi:CheY-like chemotaxis protein